MRLALLFLCAFVGMLAAAYGAEKEKFAVYYSDQAPIKQFAPYDLLVLDSRHHPELQALSEQGKTLLGYVSLGEIEKTSPYFAELKNNGLVLQQNKNWKGSYFIDLRNPLWTKIVIEQIVPSVLAQGFNGVFFDTLDSPLELERSNPSQYSGMRDAAIHLIEAVRMHYPQAHIMVNRAYPILPRVASSVDMVLGESVFGEYDFAKKSYVRVPASLYRQQVTWLQEAKQQNPQLKIYTLDYADPHNRKAIGEIYHVQRENGFIPYVATVKLDELVAEKSE